MAARRLFRNTKPQIDFAVLCGIFAFSLFFLSDPLRQCRGPGIRSRTGKNRAARPHWPHGGFCRCSN